MDPATRIIYQFEGRQELEKLLAAMGRESAVLENIIAQHKQAGFATAQHSQQAQQAANNINGYVRQIEALETKMKGTGLSTKEAGRAALEASHAFQDFAQAGVGGILNNIPRLAEVAGAFMPKVVGFFGGPLGFAASVTATSVSLYAFRDQLSGFLTWLTGSGEGIPKATDAVGKLEEAVKSTKDRLAELEGSWKGTAENLAEHNRLTGELLGLETQLNEQRERRNTLDAQRKKEQAGEADSIKAASEAVKKAGGVDKVAADLTKAMPGATNAAQAQLDQLKRELASALAGDRPAGETMNAARARFAPQIAAAEETLRKAQAEAKAGASDLMARYLQGDQGAIARVNTALPDRGLGDASTTAVAARKEAEKTIKDELKRFPDVFKTGWEEVRRRGDLEQDRRDSAFMKTTEWSPEGKVKAQTMRRAQERAPRLANNAYQDKIDATSTPEELRQSSAINYIMRQNPKLQLEGGQWIKLADSALANLDAGLDQKTAAAEAVRDIQDPQRRIRQEAQLHEIEARIDVDTGGMLTPDQRQSAARQTQALMGQGVMPAQAAQMAIDEVLQAVQSIFRSQSQGFSLQAQQAAMLGQQARQIEQTAPSLLFYGQ